MDTANLPRRPIEFHERSRSMIAVLISRAVAKRMPPESVSLLCLKFSVCKEQLDARTTAKGMMTLSSSSLWLRLRCFKVLLSANAPQRVFTPKQEKEGVRMSERAGEKKIEDACKRWR